MNALLKAVVALPVAAAAFLAGCNPYAEGLKRANAKEQAHNRTLTKAAIVMNGVKAWSAAHGGELPNAQQFRNEVRPVLPSTNGFGITDAELKEAHAAFQWTFAGGRVEGTGGSEREVGRLADPHGGAIGYANGEVRRGFN
ncbi:hypothetical protein EON81_08525 [bacterium]|nr:MAG: hypothetical protein EON81_08525 [bacterium]